MSIADSLNPKNMFFNAIGRKLKDQGIEKIVMIFNVITDKYDIMVRNTEGGKLKIDITDSQITLLKKMFLNKIIKKFSIDFPDVEIQKIILQVNLNENEFEVFIEDQKQKITKFETN